MVMKAMILKSWLPRMFNWDDSDMIQDLFLTDAFKVESEYLTKRRAELIAKDKVMGNKMLINNPTRDISLRKPTVLIRETL